MLKRGKNTFKIKRNTVLVLHIKSYRKKVQINNS